MGVRRAGTGATPPAPGQLVHVTWEDCFSHEPWTPVEQLAAARKPPIMTTVGWYQGAWEGQTCTFWALSSGIQTEAGNVHGGGSWFIPHWSIVSWRAL